MSGGVIIAGGRSTRFGDADKAVAKLAGTPMIRRVADRLTPTVDQIVVNCREDQLEAIRDAMAGYDHPVTYAKDERPDLGPMAGIKTGLEAVAAEYAIVVACDMPFFEPALAEYLFERAAGHDAAVPRLDDEWFQTTQAVYRADAMALSCERALERGDRKIIKPLFELDYVVVDEPEFTAVAHQRTFENINTREEFDAANRRIDGEG